MQFLSYDSDGFPTAAQFDIAWVQRFLGTVAVAGQVKKLLRATSTLIEKPEVMLIDWLPEPVDQLHAFDGDTVSSFPLYKTYPLEEVIADPCFTVDG